MQQPRVVVEPEQQRADDAGFFGITKPTHHAVRRSLRLDPPAGARPQSRPTIGRSDRQDLFGLLSVNRGPSQDSPIGVPAKRLNTRPTVKRERTGSHQKASGTSPLSHSSETSAERHSRFKPPELAATVRRKWPRRGQNYPEFFPRLFRRWIWDSSPH